MYFVSKHGSSRRLVLNNPQFIHFNMSNRTLTPYNLLISVFYLLEQFHLNTGQEEGKILQL